MDIVLRNKEILRLFRVGVSRKEIGWRLEPRMTYEAVKKVIQKYLIRPGRA